MEYFLAQARAGEKAPFAHESTVMRHDSRSRLSFSDRPCLKEAESNKLRKILPRF